MVRFRALFGGVALLATVLLISTLGVAGYLSQNARLIQLIEPQSESTNALFGTNGPGTAIGSPQIMIIQDPLAFLSGRSNQGAEYVSDPYLKAKNIYPLQLKTVELFRNLLGTISFLFALIFGALWWRSTQLKRISDASATPLP